MGKPLFEKSGFSHTLSPKTLGKGREENSYCEFTQKTVSEFYLYDNGSKDILT